MVLAHVHARCVEYIDFCSSSMVEVEAVTLTSRCLMCVWEELAGNNADRLPLGQHRGGLAQARLR